MFFFELRRARVWRRAAVRQSSDKVNAVSICGVEVGLRGGAVDRPMRPQGYVSTLPPSLVPVLRWLAQRDALGQDALLVVSPGERSRARHVALAFAEAANAEAYYVGVSADTTESELRQRRELSGRGSYFSDAPPVVAAVRGGVLVLDGLERAERNVLPTLNNLLENRELSLDDGRVLMPETKMAGGIPREFRVVAIAAPCPPFEGRALDPPLRSRLCARVVPPADVSELAGVRTALSDEEHRRLVEATATLVELEKDDRERAILSSAKSTFFSTSTAAVLRAARRAAECDTARSVLRKAYPALLFERDLGATLPAGIFANDDELAESVATDDKIGELWLSAAQRLVFEGAKRDLERGARVLIVGPRGGGKSALARMLVEDASRVACHSDMTSRDLQQRRDVAASGASVWRDAPFVAAARRGEAVVLDGVHRLGPGVLAAGLGRACEDGVIDVPDGSRVDATRAAVVALAEPTNVKKWLTPELAAMFTTYVLDDWTDEEDVKVALESLVPELDDVAKRQRLAHIVVESRRDNDPSTRLSTRALMRLARGLASPNAPSLRSLVRDVLMAKFLPVRLSDKMDSWFEGDDNSASADDEARWSVRRDRGRVVARLNEQEVASLRVRVRGTSPELVPHLGTAYVASAASEAAVAQLARLVANGERFVAILGNQGVGKNVVVDKFLELWDAEREYAQLHRDTTLSTLTTTPTLGADGRLSYVDAPLARAAIQGRVAVLDEADKAPHDVVAALKGLAADGELHLADGRVLREKPRPNGTDVQIHQDFVLILLANRPGYPFHGHELVQTCGDAFATFAVDNPDLASETALLETIAPAVDEGVRKRLATAFAELRARFDGGGLSYPYSMRECLHVARHLDAYPGDSHAEALANVLAHDAASPNLRLVAQVLEAHGFEGVAERLLNPEERMEPSIEYVLSSDVVQGSGGASIPRTDLGNPKFGKVDPTGAPHVGGNTWAGGSGGSDTAGIGGRGGPYRLWDGKNMPHQVDDAFKAQVSEEAKRVAREQADAAHRERLLQIDNLTERDWALYKDMLERIGPHVSSLRRALENATDTKGGRVWLKRRSDGDLDDDRLVDGVAGDRLVYKRRGDKDDGAGDDKDEDATPKIKSICFLMDVSGSMYRFQMVDGRLSRMLESALYIMEALEGLEDRYEYMIRGHSGSTASVDFVDFQRPPKNRGDRLKVLERMVAHSQFCDSGDATLPATRKAIADVLRRRREHSDDDDPGLRHGGHRATAARALVVALTDANFRRYGIDPRDWARDLSAEANVEGYAIMVGSIGNEADLVSSSLPNGRGHVAMDADDLPLVFTRVLRHAGILDDAPDPRSSSQR